MQKQINLSLNEDLIHTLKTFCRDNKLKVSNLIEGEIEKFFFEIQKFKEDCDFKREQK